MLGATAPLHARCAGRARRQAAPGTRPRAARRGLSRRAADGVRRGAAGGRVVRVPDRLRPRRSDRAVRPARGRRPAAAPADAAAPLGRDDRRPVRPARRGRRCGVAGDPWRRRGRRLPRGRRRPAADRLGAAARGDAPRPRAVGAGRRLPALAGEPLRAAPPGADPARRGGGHRRQRGDGAGGPPAAPDPARPAARGRPRAAGRVRSRAPGAGRGSRGGRPARAARAARRATSCCPGGSTPGWTSRPCSRRWGGWPRRRGPTGCRRCGLAAADPARRRQPGRSRRDRPRRVAAGDRRSPQPTRRRSPSRTSPTSSAVRAACVLPVLSEAAGLPVVEAIAAGTPVVASAVGPLPELVGAAGLLVEPRDAARLAVALATIWSDDRVHDGIAAHRPVSGPRRSAGPGRTSPARPGRSTPPSASKPGRTVTAGRSPRPTRRAAAPQLGEGEAAGVPGATVDALGDRHGRRRLHDLDERLADGQRDFLAVLVEELRRPGHRRLLPGAEDRPAVGRDPRLARADDVRLQAVLVRMAVVERPEMHDHHDHVLGRDPLAVRRVLLLAFHADRAEVRVRGPVVAIHDLVGEVRRADDRRLPAGRPAARRARTARPARRPSPWRRPGRPAAAAPGPSSTGCAGRTAW